MKDEQIQREHQAWLEGMFPGQTPDIPAAGMVEEAGELLHCLLKVKQERKWGQNPRYRHLREDLEDAIGDCAIYACSLCDAMGWDFRTDVPTALRGDPMDLAIALVQLATTATKPTHIVEDVRAYVGLLRSIAEATEVDFDGAVERTWIAVRDRDRSPKPTVVCLCGSTRFREEYRRAFFREEHAGRIVLTCGCFKEDQCCKDDGAKAGWDAKHRHKIRMSDEILVLDCEVYVCQGCGAVEAQAEKKCGLCGGENHRVNYVGDSTRGEIDFAVSLGKRVRYYSKEKV